MFGLLSETAQLLRQAHDIGQAWESNISATEGGDGRADGGCEIRIVIKPKK